MKLEQTLENKVDAMNEIMKDLLIAFNDLKQDVQSNNVAIDYLSEEVKYINELL